MFVLLFINCAVLLYNHDLSRCRNNQLKTLPSELARCGELRDLILSFNRFSKIPPVVYQLKKLEHIIADGNQVWAHPTGPPLSGITVDFTTQKFCFR